MYNSSEQNKQMPLVSFIIADYNLPTSLLRECLASVLSVKLNPEEREIILIDDGCDVSPLPELADFSDEIIYIRQQNAGLSAARNHGIDVAQGKYIQFVDGDDALIKQAYEICLDTIRKTNADMVLFDTSTTNTKNESIKVSMVGSGVSHMRNNNIKGAACGYIFRKELLSDDLRFTPGILHEDEEFTPLLLLRAKSVWQLNSAAYFYRTRSGSITNDISMLNLSRRFDDLIGVLCRLKSKAALLDGVKKEALERRIHQVSMDFVYNTMILGHDLESTEKAIATLKHYTLFPLPLKGYTAKYYLFALLTRSTIVRACLTKYLTRS